MGRSLVTALGVAAAMALATPAAAQVDIGVWTPNGGGRVVLGAPSVYYPAPVYYPPPVYVYREPRVYIVERYVYPRRFPPGRARGHFKARRDYYGYPRYVSRPYRGDRFVRNDHRDGRYDRGRGRGRGRGRR